MTNSTCASSRGFAGFYAIAIIISCLMIDGALARSTRSTLNVTCDAVKAVFAENTNVSIASLEYGKLRDASGTADSTCGGACCDRDTEDRLRHQARADFHNLIHHHSRSLQGLLATTAVALRETVTALARQSENKTLTLFEQVYRSMSISIRPSIKALYQAMVDYVSPENTPDTLQQPLTREMLQERFNEFFVRLFPIAYNRAVNPTSENDFTEKFKKCLYETIEEIQPFGDIPKQISRSVGTSLEATRVLVQALTLGRRVLDRTDSVLFYGTSPQQAACYEALLRMTYCPKCAGIGANVRPCGGLCTNVMRGCLTEPASELDLAWSGYVETVERLVVAVDGKTNPLGLNAEKAVKQLDQRISDAIMHAMENGPALDEKVRNVCGHAEPETSPPSANIEDSSASGSYPHQATNQPHKALPTQLHVQLGNFLASVVRSRTFYGTLADAICEEYPDKRCWNGERVGEYTKTVVDSSLTAQRYNPEFTMPGTAAATTTSYGNANTNELIDQLRHINQMVQSQLASAPDNGVLLSDEALDGSGSGSRPIGRKKHNGFYAGGGKHENCPDCEDDDNSREEGRDDDDDDDDNGDEEASGSGSGPATISTSEGTSNEQVPHGAATRNALTPATILVLLWLSVYA